MLVLASRSPRRKRLLSALGISFEARPVEIDETVFNGESPAEIVRRIAGEKALAAKKRNNLDGAEAILAADTIVVLDGETLGKPSDKQDAVRMLEKLSGRTHKVFTGIFVIDKSGAVYNDVVRTQVTFRPLGKKEIEEYAASGEARDKAGSYAIQGAGGAMVDRIEGSYTNVIGLPLAETLKLLEKTGVCRDG